MMFPAYLTIFVLLYIVCRRASINLEYVTYSTFYINLLISSYFSIYISSLVSSFYFFHLFITFGDINCYLYTSRIKILGWILGLILSGVAGSLFYFLSLTPRIFRLASNEFPILNRTVGWINLTVYIVEICYVLYATIYLYEAPASLFLWGKLITDFFLE